MRLGRQAWGDNDPAGNVKIGPGTFAMQSLWSNVVSGCVMNGGLRLTVTTPATQTATLGKAVSLRIRPRRGAQHAFDVHGVRAARRPVHQQVHRRISGTPNVTAGTFTSKVTVAYYAGWHTIRFGWQVGSPRGDEGVHAKCLGDYNASTTGQQDRHLDLHRRRRAEHHLRGEQRAARGRRLRHGRDDRVPREVRGATSQEWTRQSNGEYVLKSNGKCLTAPSANNGTQLTLAACANTANQHWALP